MKEVLFELSQVEFSYLGKFPALCGVDLKIEQGSKIAIIGANGSGKSTLLQMLDALIFPDKGSLKAFGRDLTEKCLDDQEFSHFFRRKVGFVFQNPDVQLFCPSVKDDILFGPLQLRMPMDQIKKNFEQAVEEFQLAPLLERAPHQLSIGEKRKVAMASVLAIDPDVLILDEPTAGLDPLTVRHIIDFILQANKRGKTIITATHDLHVVAEISDMIHVFGKDKKVCRYGRAVEILSDQPFLNAHNLLHIHGHIHKDKVHVHPHVHLGDLP